MSLSDMLLIDMVLLALMLLAVVLGWMAWDLLRAWFDQLDDDDVSQ